jgi:Dolichyl-phosphate-mannose-protein mannosyltransferase
MSRSLVAVAVLAVVLRLVYAWFGVSPQLTDDETHFWAIAGNIAAGDGYTYEGEPTAWRPPAYTFALAGLRAVGAGVRGVQVVQAIVGAATPLLLWALARRLGLPRWAALGAGLVAAAYPPFVHFPSQMLSENLAIPLLCAALLVTVRLLATLRPADAALCGSAWALAALARPSSLPACGVAIVAVALGRSWRPRLLAAGTVTLVCLALLAPWAARNAVAVGGPVPVVSNEGFTSWVSNRLDARHLKDVFDERAYTGIEDYGVYGRAFPGIASLAARDGFDFDAASEAKRDAWFRERLAADVRADPLRFVSRAAAKSAAVLAPAPENASREERTSAAATAVLWVTSGPVLVLGLSGLVGLAVRGGRSGRFLAAAALVSLVSLATHLPYVRYRVGAVDPILIVAASWLAAQYPRKRERRQLGDQLGEADERDQQQRGGRPDRGRQHERRGALADT